MSRQTYLEEQRQRTERMLKKRQDQKAETEQINLAIASLWGDKRFQTLLLLLDTRFDAERHLTSEDEYKRRMAAEYWSIRKEMEILYGNQQRAVQATVTEKAAS